MTMLRLIQSPPKRSIDWTAAALTVGVVLLGAFGGAVVFGLLMVIADCLGML